MSGFQRFLDLAERQMAAPVKARQRAADKRRAAKRDDEQQKLSARYRAWRREELDDELAGQDGEKVAALLARLERLTLETIPDLAAFVRAAGWHTAAADTLFMVRRLAAESVMRARERGGLPPFDDPLPGEPATPEMELSFAFTADSNGD